MEPHFTIITTTYHRPREVLRAVSSVQSQTHTHWQHLIIIDDPISDYSELTTVAAKDTRITIHRNETNRGKNASVNAAQNILRDQNFSGYVIFLDDDDWLAADCLAEFAHALTLSPHERWLVSNRTNNQTKIPYTKNTTGRNHIHYRRDCLLTHRFVGDATHCLHVSFLLTISFPHHIKNAEEWLFFATVAKQTPTFLYLPVTGTYSDGYSTQGLSDLYHRNTERKKNLRAIITEVWTRRLFHPTILLYVLVRILTYFR